jgi:spermidine/putrescine transport system permease protein
MTVPSLAWLLLFFCLPTLIIFAIAFKPSDYYGHIGNGWTLSVVQDLFHKPYTSIIWRTFWISLTSTVICLLVAIPMAYYISRLPKNRQQTMLLLTVVPFWTSFLVRIFAWKLLLHPEGSLKKGLIALSIIEPETSLLYHAGAVLLVTVYTYLPFAVLPIYAATSKFNYQLIEAALDLGATRLRAFIKVFLPGISQGVVTAFLMVFIPISGSYVIPDVVGGTDSEMIGNKIAQRTFIDRNLPEASALSALLALTFLIPLILFTWFNWRKKRLKGARA